jgi:hypothetical protein
MSTSTKLTVAETISKLKEKNPNPRRIYNKAELTLLVQAMLNDSEYVALNTKVKAGIFITEERRLAGEFKKALVDLVKQLGLNSDEAKAIVAEYKVPRALAASIIDAVAHASFVYMKDVGKGINLIGESDVQQTIFFRQVGDKSHRIPKTRDGKDPAHSKVKVASHRRLAMKTKVNPIHKQLLK